MPFIASTLLARFWPAVRHAWQAATGRLQAAWHMRGKPAEETGAAAAAGGREAGLGPLETCGCFLRLRQTAKPNSVT